MKKIGTLTFHWATNYGAVLQAWALQQYLLEAGYETEIIRYLPRRIRLIQRLQALRRRDFSWFSRERGMAAFRKKALLQSRKTYPTGRALLRAGRQYDAVICGSDQIWNPSFTLTAEGKPTLSYFLHFIPEGIRRIAYAASFGAGQLPEEMERLIRPELQKFHAVSVREETGRQILSRLGFFAKVVCDPTLLLERSAYDRLIEAGEAAPPASTNSGLFSYILHAGQGEALRTTEFCRRLLGEEIAGSPSSGGSPSSAGSVYAWLKGIRDAAFVVTNSFHGTVFSILFHRPFITLPVEGADMDDRLHTLLSALGLENRWLPAFDPERVRALYADPIDWRSAESRLTKLREDSRDFIHTALEGE